jgi:hypothetical protein
MGQDRTFGGELEIVAFQNLLGHETPLGIFDSTNATYRTLIQGAAPQFYFVWNGTNHWDLGYPNGGGGGGGGGHRRTRKHRPRKTRKRNQRKRKTRKN